MSDKSDNVDTTPSSAVISSIVKRENIPAKMVCTKKTCTTRIPAEDPPLLPNIVTECCPLCGEKMELDIGQNPVFTGNIAGGAFSETTIIEIKKHKIG